MYVYSGYFQGDFALSISVTVEVIPDYDST